MALGACSAESCGVVPGDRGDTKPQTRSLVGSPLSVRVVLELRSIDPGLLVHGR